MPVPPALAAVDAFPALRRQVAPALEQQARRAAERSAFFLPRPDVVAALDEAIRKAGSGLVLLEGPPGAGATALLCHLAAARGYPLWLPCDDGGGGLAALCAQLIALARLPVPLVPPAAARDATTLERLLEEAAAARPHDGPLVVLVDELPPPDALPAPPPFPAALPPGVVLIHAVRPGQAAPLAPAARVALPAEGPQLARALLRAAIALGDPPSTAGQLVARGDRTFLYVRLAHGLVGTGVLRRRALPASLDELHRQWWDELDASGRRLALALAAAAEPLPLALAAALARTADDRAAAALRRWGPLVEWAGDGVALYHPATGAFVLGRSGDSLADTHALFVNVALSRSGGRLDQLDPVEDGYLMRQVGRHAALSDQATSRAIAPMLESRAWVAAQQRRAGELGDAARDAAWALRGAERDGPPARTVRAAALAGTLAVLGRTLGADALAEAFVTTIERGEGRDAALRRTRALLDQLPDGRDKALALRRLGEVCYEQRMRAHAMRMLSEALDLEVPGLPRAWRDEREETQVAFARAAITAGAPDMALGITVRIGHPERRGLIETEVVRSLLAQAMLTRAEEVAHAIGHAHTHEWAMAEVAAGHARSGNTRRSREVLSTLKTVTAVAWARTELACDAARRGDTAAVEQVATLSNEQLRDRALGLVAQALVVGGQPATALIAVRQIVDRELRARALIDLALLRLPNRHVALAHAADDVQAIGGDERTPLVVALATAYAATGDLEGALRAAALLHAGEERDRAHSRVAAALARQGDHAAARRIALAIPDDDERGWTLHELARLRTETGDWRGAAALIAKIADEELRARAEADLCIGRARGGSVKVAQEQVALIPHKSERVRALVAMAEPLVRQGGAANVAAALGQVADPNARSRFHAALAAAWAVNGRLEQAEAEVAQAARPADRVRALVALARAAARSDAAAGLQALGRALRTAAGLGRSETFACLASAADVLVAIGGAELLLAAAHALDEIDGWWA